MGSFAAVCGLFALLVGLFAGMKAVREHRAIASLPSASPSARNVVLIVWDTVCNYNVSLNGYHRDTTPNLNGWAKAGVTYKRAISAAPSGRTPRTVAFLPGSGPLNSIPSGSSRSTRRNRRWPNSWRCAGYQTAGFVANTNCCSWESGLGRGFSHYDDYLLSPRSLLTRTVPGHWLATNFLHLGDLCEMKWLGLQSRGAADINKAFLGWLGQRRSDRPFFAFLNYFDVHEPYIPPPSYVGRFGVAPVTPGEFIVPLRLRGTAQVSAQGARSSTLVPTATTIVLPMSMTCWVACSNSFDRRGCSTTPT